MSKFIIAGVEIEEKVASQFFTHGDASELEFHFSPSANKKLIGKQIKSAIDNPNNTKSKEFKLVEDYDNGKGGFDRVSISQGVIKTANYELLLRGENGVTERLNLTLNAPLT